MLCVAIALLLGSQLASPVSSTALDDYVFKQDPEYKYEYMGAEFDMTGHDLVNKNSWKGYCLNVTSQRWLTDADFSPESQAKVLALIPFIVRICFFLSPLTFPFLFFWTWFIFPNYRASGGTCWW